MRNLMKAFFFKLVRDWTFRITLFIGLGLSVMMTLLFLVLDHAFPSDMGIDGLFCTGQNLFYSSLSPAQNFGIAVPVNLISFTVLEFTQGSIRNKIIAGNSKGKIYLSLLLSGLVFTLSLVFAYVGLSTLLGSIFGGFDINGMMAASGKMNVEFFWKILVLTLLAYILINCITIFFATLIRGIGPCIPLVIILLLAAYLSASILGGTASSMTNLQGAARILRLFNPLYSVAHADVVEGNLTITNESFWIEVINTLVYGAIFVTAGFLIFKKRDVK